jgi:hypothetical protein
MAVLLEAARRIQQPHPQIEAPAVVEAEVVEQVSGPEQKDTTGGYKLDDKQVAKILLSRGRRSMPSIYLDAMEHATQHRGEYFGVDVTPELNPDWIKSQLRKAARQLGLDTHDFSVHDRTVDGFIGYTVHPLHAGRYRKG